MSKFNVDSLRKAVESKKIQWQLHALERMMERGIFRKEVIETLSSGIVIEEYSDDKPFPSALFLHVTRRALHVVAALNEDMGICHVITAYEPDMEVFGQDYKTRRVKS